MLDIDYSAYIAYHLRRRQREQESLKQRHRFGLLTAKYCADLLKNDFKVSKVVLFGSMLTGDIHSQSDIDLAVWGLPVVDYFKAISALDNISSMHRFTFDLIDMDHDSVRDYIRLAINDGIVL